MTDDWIAVDKLEHFLMCFLIVMVCALTMRFTIHSSKLLHRWVTWVACMISLTAGAAKELGDEMGLWPSAGGSMKDGIADGGGVLAAALLLYCFNPRGTKPAHEGLEHHGPLNV